MALFLCLASAAVQGQTPVTLSTNSPTAEIIVLPESVPDPLEPLNRAMWGFNKGFMTHVIKPTSSAYLVVVVKPIRKGIANFGRNLTYPGRLINNALQGKWIGARDETYRFLCNSTAGVAGFIDVAGSLDIPKSDADFGQTFGQWGWKPNFYLMLPFLGPSNDRDLVGFGADTAANPLLYISPYKFNSHNPLSYLGPYTYLNYVVMYNNLSDSVNEYVRFSQAEADPYADLQYAWTFARANQVADFQVKGEQDKASLETMESIFFTYKNPDFPEQGKTKSVVIPATGRRLKFTYWLQPNNAPIVYIVPGLGSHRLAQASVALAELAYNNGFSAVCVSSPFNSEFMEQAATAALPAYLPVDGHDLQSALTVIDHHLEVYFPGRLGKKAVMGYSMGALESLYMNADTTNSAGLIHFDRCVALNTPVRLQQGITKLDEFYRAPLEWPAAERTNDLQNTFLKVAALSKSTLTPQTTLPFSAIESKFLIGLDFRLILRDIIYSSQRRHNQGLLVHSLHNFRRSPAYKEIMLYSYSDYFAKFAVPYYAAKGIDAAGPALQKAGDLRTYEAGLKANPNIRVIVNQNDFLLEPADLAWLRATITSDQLTVFPEGGHLGNLFNPTVQKSILGALDGLKTPAK